MRIAASFKVINGKIQLFDKNGKKLTGNGTKWEGDFDCSSNPALTSLEGEYGHKRFLEIVEGKAV